MTDVTIRKAVAEDIDAIYGLVRELAIFEKEPDAMVAKPDEYRDAFKEGLIDAFVAVSDGKIIGMALFYMTFSTWKGKSLYLEDFYVQPEYRGRNTGQLLFDAFLAEARRRSAYQTKWQVLDWNTDAQRFYQRNNASIETNWWNGKIVFPRP